MTQGFHTKEDIIKYGQAMSNDEYDNFTAYYTPDVSMKLPTGDQIHGRQAVKEYFQKVREDMSERLELSRLVLDHEGCVVRAIANYLPKKDFIEVNICFHIGASNSISC